MACFNVIALSPDGESAAQVFYKRDFARDEFFSRCSTGKPGSVVVMKVDGQEMARVTVQAKDA